MGTEHRWEIRILYFWRLTNSFSYRRSLVTSALESCNKSMTAGADDPMPTVYGFGGAKEEERRV